MRIATVATLLVFLLPAAALAGGGVLEERIASLPDESGDRVVRVAQAAPLGGAPLPQMYSNVRGTPWRWEITPYFWAAGITGDITADGRKAEINSGIGDLFSSAAANAGLGMGLEIWNNDGGFLFATEYVSQGDDRSSYEVRVDQAMMEVGAAYRFGQVAERRAGRSRWSTAEFQILGRWVFLKQEVNLTGGATESSRTDWWEVVLGVATDFKLSKSWEISGKWDIGGFGISTAANIDTNIKASIGYVISRSVILELGYRISYLDYTRGSGANEVAFSAFRHGLLLAATFRF